MDFVCSVRILCLGESNKAGSDIIVVISLVTENVLTIMGDLIEVSIVRIGHHKSQLDLHSALSI